MERPQGPHRISRDQTGHGPAGRSAEGGKVVDGKGYWISSRHLEPVNAAKRQSFFGG